MRGILEFVLHGRCTHREHGTRLHDQPVRSYDELERICKKHGSPFAAAIAGVVNGEEYVRMEKIREH